jgi:hypothetical protein
METIPQAVWKVIGLPFADVNFIYFRPLLSKTVRPTLKTILNKRLGNQRTIIEWLLQTIDSDMKTLAGQCLMDETTVLGSVRSFTVKIKRPPLVEAVFWLQMGLV